MDKLPENYHHYTRRCVDIVLKPFTLDDLVEESFKCNPRAQKAVLVKLDHGIHEAKEWSIEKRVDKILWFWDQVKDVNSKSDEFGLVWEYSIMSAIKETVIGERLYSSDVEAPEYYLIEYAVDKMKEYDLGERFTTEFKECYERIK